MIKKKYCWFENNPRIYITVITTQIAEWQYPPAQRLQINKQQKQNQA